MWSVAIVDNSLHGELIEVILLCAPESIPHAGYGFWVIVHITLWQASWFNVESPYNLPHPGL